MHDPLSKVDFSGIPEFAKDYTRQLMLIETHLTVFARGRHDHFIDSRLLKLFNIRQTVSTNRMIYGTHAAELMIHVRALGVTDAADSIRQDLEQYPEEISVAFKRLNEIRKLLRKRAHFTYLFPEDKYAYDTGPRLRAGAPYIENGDEYDASTMMIMTLADTFSDEVLGIVKTIMPYVIRRKQ